MRLVGNPPFTAHREAGIRDIEARENDRRNRNGEEQIDVLPLFVSTIISNGFLKSMTSKQGKIGQIFA